MKIKDGGTYGDWEWAIGSNRTGGCGIRRRSQEVRGGPSAWVSRLDGSWVSRPLPRGTVQDYRCKQDGWAKYVILNDNGNGQLVPTTLKEVLRELPAEMRGIVLQVHYGRLNLNRIQLERQTMYTRRLREDLTTVIPDKEENRAGCNTSS